jgi:osmotically-inducible protein OsmY
MSSNVLKPCLMALIAAAALGGCSMFQAKTFGESLDEASAGTEIKTKLFTNGGPSRFGEVDVEVADRFVLLSGRVPSEADKAEAERIAWTAKAVDEVANELVVENRDIGRDINDRWITEQVRARLLANSDVKSLNYNIQVYDGVVYLMGFARSDEELRDAAETASRVKGVQKVVSYVKLRTRAASPVQAGDRAPDRTLQPSGAPSPIHPDYQEPSQIVVSEPTTRGQYSDPYAPGATPPPGASNNASGLESSPLPPLVP